MHNGSSKVLLVLVAGMLATGCTSLTASQTANTMGRGGMQFALEPSYANWGGVGFPRMDLALRYGITDSIDIGGRIGSSFAELNGKFQVTNPANDGFVASIAPSVGGIHLSASSGSSSSSAGIINFALPVLLGIKVGEGSQLVFGPRIQDFLLEASSSSGSSGGSALANVIAAGASVGFAGKVTDGFRLMPEVGVVFPLNASASSSNGSSASDSLAGGSVLWQVSLAFLFGQYHQPSSHNDPTMPPTPGSSAPYPPANGGSAPPSYPPPQ